MLLDLQIERCFLITSLLVATSCQPTNSYRPKLIAELPYLAARTVNPALDTVAFQVAGLSEQPSSFADKWLWSKDQQYAILLRQDADTAVVFPVIIEKSDAQLLAVAIEHMTTQRPLLPALMQTVIQRTGYRLTSVIIDRLDKGTFYSTMYLRGPQGQKLALDSRPVDAIGQALLARCPLYVLRSVAREAQDLYLYGQ